MAHHQLQAPEQGKIRFILYSLDSLYLDIPTSIPPLMCQRPRKYLRYLGWCILGVEAQVAMDSPHSEQDIGNEGSLEDQGVYRYCYNSDGDLEGDPLRHAIDPSVMNLRSTVVSGRSLHSATSSVRGAFHANLVERDTGCVITGHWQCEGMHIIPYARQDEWFQLLVASRLPYDEDVSDLNSVNDIRNGMLGALTLHGDLDSRVFAFLKTPNRVLNVEDMLERRGRNLADEVEYPADARFTLHLLEDGPRRALADSEFPWHGRDAAFKRGTDLAKPSALLLHYHYGAAAVKRWGHHRRFLSASHRRNIPRPEAAVTPGPSGPSTTVHDRTIAIQKRQRPPDTAGSSKRRRGRPRKRTVGREERGQDDSDMGNVIVEAVDGSTGWDEDDWMQFFWTNTKAARERRQVAEEEFSSRINEWASEVSHG